MTVTAAQRERTNAPGSWSMTPSAPSPCEAPLPAITAPNVMNRQLMIAAVLKRTILVPTAVPKIFAASLAPRDHPMNRPLERKIRLNIYAPLHHSLHCIDEEVLGYILRDIGKTS